MKRLKKLKKIFRKEEEEEAMDPNIPYEQMEVNPDYLQNPVGEPGTSANTSGSEPPKSQTKNYKYFWIEKD